MLTPHTFKTLKRSKDIVVILVRNGLDYLVERLDLPGHGVFKKLAPAKPATSGLSMPVRIRKVFEELGPTYIKFGQILSTRPDLIPGEYIREFSKLQDRVPASPFEDIVDVVTEELGGPPDTVFKSFSRDPVASASISQVHRAVLLNGREVAVKVQKQSIASEIISDMEILHFLAHLIEERIPEIEYLNPTDIVAEFEYTIQRELDFTIELRNLIRFRENFREWPSPVLPRPFPELSTPRILTMEYLPGKPLHLCLDAPLPDRKKWAKTGLRAILKQVFEDGFFQADPHPGNLKILPDGRMAMVDFGIVGRITDDLYYFIVDILGAISNRDYTRVAGIVIDVGDAKEPIDMTGFIREIGDIVDYHHPDMHDTGGVGKSIEGIAGIALRHRIRLPANLSMMFKALMIAEDVGRQLDPDIDIMGMIKPHLARIMRQRYSPVRFGNLLLSGSRDFLYMLNFLPGELSYILRKLKNGELAVEFRHAGLDELIYTLGHSSNRLSFSMIIAALIVGSSIIIGTGIGHRLFGYPALGLLGFLIAGFLGLWLLIMIIRSRKI